MSPAANASAPDDSGATSQTLRAQVGLRELILSGELPAGTRVSEQTLVDRLGVSRTPVRAALLRLAEEGLVEPQASGGFSIRAFSEAQIHDAIELRGTLEGLAARLAAERGAPRSLLAQAQACLARIDAALGGAPAGDEAFEDAFAVYSEENQRFHALVAAMAGSDVVQRQLDRVLSLPFASPNGFLRAQARGPRARDDLFIAHQQHHAVLEAIENREGARAEALMREHARHARRNLQQALASSQDLALVPGGRLIRRVGP